MASLTTHDAYRPGPWATDQVRLWQTRRQDALKQTLSLMEKVGADGVYAGSRIYGFWWNDDVPASREFWTPLTMRRPNGKVGYYRSKVGPNGRVVWQPRKWVKLKRAGETPRLSPLWEQVTSIEIPDWWDFAVLFGLRPMLWPNNGVMLMPEIDVAGDYGEKIVIWSPRDRFGMSIVPTDCEPMSRKEVRAHYEGGYSELQRIPVVEVYIGDGITRPDFLDKPRRDAL